MRMVILGYAGLIEYLNQRNGWVVCHIFELEKRQSICRTNPKKTTETETDDVE